MIIDGKQIADSIIERTKALPKTGKFFGAVLVGDDAASINFLKQKERVAKELGIEFRLYQLPARYHDRCPARGSRPTGRAEDVRRVHRSAAVAGGDQSLLYSERDPEREGR